MNIIIFMDKKKKFLNLFLSPLRCIGALIFVVTLVIACFFAGYQYAVNRSAELVYAAHDRAPLGWEARAKAELNVLQDVKTRTEASLNAMASRLSLLQSHVMRLDALGSRLAAMAKLDDIEFGVENPPGIGGPQAMLDVSSQKFPEFDFLISLNRLEHTLQDRQDKLSAMEAMLMGKSLQEQALPAGNPAKGGWLSSSYGYRADPITGKREFHQGIDFAGKSDTLVTAVAAGIVSWSGPGHGYGNLVEINHGNGYVTKYAHNKKNLVVAGEKVEKGKVIALMGNSGRSTGTHVHFEVVRNGKHVNPGKYIPLQ